MPENQNIIFPKGEKAPADYFTGTTWVRMLVTNDPTLNCQIGNVVFEPGARNNWHTHPGGQILIATDGIGYYQEKPPQRFIAGADAIGTAEQVVATLQQQLNAYRELSSSLAY